MASGINCSDECVEVYNEMKLRNTHKFLIFRIVDDREIQIEHRGDSSTAYEAFLDLLPNDDCRYAVVDFAYQTDDGRPQNKLVFVNWAPETSRIKSKMVYASSKENFKRRLVGLSKEVQATDASEVAFDIVRDQMLRV